MIKIAHCMCSLEGGVGKVVMNYFDNMPSEDYEVHIITQAVGSDKYIEMYEKRGYIIHVVPSKKESLFLNLKKTYRIFKDEDIDIVHCHMTVTNVFPLFIATLAGIKVRISHSHLAANKNIFESFLCFLGKLFATDRFACGQEAGEAIFGKSSFRIIQNAIDLKRYKYSEEVRDTERKKLGLANNKVICHVGRFSSQKNHDFLIDVFEKLHQEDSGYKLMLIGDGELLEKVKTKVEQIGLTEHVLFLGLIDDVNIKLQASDVFILPSLFEGLCLAAIEAQASGIPCVLSDTVDYRTKINENVILVESFDIDKWKKNIQDAFLEKRCTSQQKLVEEGFDIETEAKRLNDFYKESLSRKR